MTADLNAIVTGRSNSLFSPDLALADDRLREAVEGRRLLFIGGAGSIGSSTLRAALVYRPAQIDVVDLSENNLAELVRDLRSSLPAGAIPELRMIPLDYGSPIMRRLLNAEPPYDLILNFAALKHVRSEKDAYALLQMIDTNILKQVRFLRWLGEQEFAGRFFSVSTDKAANPVNLMGATKRLMEHAVFSEEALGGRVTSARFANVAFSDGSLLFSWLKRMERRQPLAVPRDTKRFFVSLPESGQICILAAAACPSDHIVVPGFDPTEDLHDLREIAHQVLHHLGFEPREYDEAEEARLAVDREMESGRYPLIVTAADTSGEKPYEEFFGESESPVDIGLPHLLAVPHLPARQGSLGVFLEEAGSWVENPLTQIGKSAIAESIARVVPDFRHRETGKSLDARL